MSFYSDLQQSAQDLLSEFGQGIIINTKTPGAYNPVTGQSVITVTTQYGNGAIFDRGSRDIDGQLILQGDKKLLLSQIGITDIRVNDTVTIGFKDYTVTMVKTLNPAGTNVMFICNLRGV
jgi:hypothetical protein